MLRNLYLKTIRDERRSLFWWSVVTAVLAFIIALVYPAYHQQGAAIQKFWDEAPAFMKAFFGEEFDFATPEGFLAAEVFSTTAPVIFLIFGIAAGARAIAGEEQNGTMDILMAQPISRTRIVLDKFAAMASTTVMLALMLLAGLLLGGLAVGMPINLPRLVATTLLTALFGLAFGAIAFMLGAWARGKGRAMGIASTVAVTTFLLNGLAPMVDWLSGFRWLSPWHWFARSAPIKHGLAPEDVAVLGGITLLALLASVPLFRRREIAV